MKISVQDGNVVLTLNKGPKECNAVACTFEAAATEIERGELRPEKVNHKAAADEARAIAATIRQAALTIKQETVQ